MIQNSTVLSEYPMQWINWLGTKLALKRYQKSPTVITVNKGLPPGKKVHLFVFIKSNLETFLSQETYSFKVGCNIKWMHRISFTASGFG